jgi:hypothetical protein
MRIEKSFTGFVLGLQRLLSIACRVPNRDLKT